eukprot:356225-Chlamydomonas_euryale.AAC.5
MHARIQHGMPTARQQTGGGASSSPIHDVCIPATGGCLGALPPAARVWQSTVLRQQLAPMHGPVHLRGAPLWTCPLAVCCCAPNELCEPGKRRVPGTC